MKTRALWVRFPSGVSTLDGPLSLGYRKSSLEDERVQIPRHQVTDDFPTRPLSVVLFGMGRCASVIELGSSTATERLVKTRRCGFESRPETSRPPLVHPSALFDGSQDWVIAHNDVVAGSSPAFGTRRRGSSVVEHVIPSSFFIRRIFLRAVDCGLSKLLVGGSIPPSRFGASSSTG